MTEKQANALDALGGQMLSVGADETKFDVATLDDAYTKWMAQDDANYAILRPDFYVAATAKTPTDLRTRFDETLVKLGVA